MAGADYLEEYKLFFTEFAATVNPEDQLPVKVGGYSLCEPELTGEFVDWIIQYLDQKRCPASLISPLAKIVVEDIKRVIKTQPAAFRRDDNITYQPLKLMQAVTAKVNEVCLGFVNLPTTSFPSPSIDCLPMSLCAVKNSRRRMEDRHTVIHDFHGVFDVPVTGTATYYGVFDGHAGTDAAVYSASHLHQYLAESAHYPHEPELAIREAFLKTDSLFLEKSTRDNLHSGTTALCALLRHDERMLYIGWAGDSQALLVTRAQPLQLVRPHKPEREDERKRIEDLGGCVMYWGMWRVNGQLAVSRAIGDLEYKPWVCAEPDIVSVPVTDQQDFLILACDGLWDFVSEQEAVISVYNTIRQHPGDLEAVSQCLVQLSKEQGSLDNISVIVVFLTAPAVLAALDVTPTPVEAMDDTVEPHTNGSTEPVSEMLQFNVADDKLKQAAVSSPSATDLYFLNRPTNGKEDGDEDDDFGPETDVDGVDDVLLSPAIAAAKAAAMEADMEVQQTSPFDGVSEPRDETPTPPADDVAGGASVLPEADNVAESGEESEEEWNYYHGEKPTAGDEEDMESRLNPNAAEFVPSPTATMPSMEELLSSMLPHKLVLSMDDVRVPTPVEFLEEVCQRPAEGMDNFASNPFGDSSFNSPPTPHFEIKTQQDDVADEPLKDNNEFIEQPNMQNPFTVSDSLFNAPDISSTSAVFGDESSTNTNTTDTDPLNRSMFEADFVEANAAEANASNLSADFFGFNNSQLDNSNMLDVAAYSTQLSFGEDSELNVFSNTNLADLDVAQVEENSAPLAVPLPEVDHNFRFSEFTEFSAPPANQVSDFKEVLETKAMSPYPDIVQDTAITSGMQRLDLEETPNQPTPSVFECSVPLNSDEPAVALTELPVSVPHVGEEADTTGLEDFLSAVAPEAPDTSAEPAVELVNSALPELAVELGKDSALPELTVELVKDSALPEPSVELVKDSPLPELAAAGAALVATVTVAAAAKTVGAAKKSPLEKSNAVTKPTAGSRGVTTKTATKSTPTSPTKPLSGQAPQAAPRVAPAKKPLPAATQVKASSFTTRVKVSAATSKVASTTTAAAKPNVNAVSQARPAKPPAAKPVPAKTTTTTLLRARPATATAAKSPAVEKKPGLANGDAKAATKRPDQLVTKKLVSTTTTASTASRPTSAPVAKTTKASTVTRATTVSSPKPAAKPAVNGVSKPKVATTQPMRPVKVSSVVPKTALVDKLGKEIANKQLSQTVKSPAVRTTTTTTSSSTAAARKAGGNVTKTTMVTTTTTGKPGGPIKRPTASKTSTQVSNAAPVEEKVVVIEEFTAAVNKDDSPIVDNAQLGLLVDTD